MPSIRALVVVAVLASLACASERASAPTPTTDASPPPREDVRVFVGPRFVAQGDGAPEYEAVVVNGEGRIVGLHEALASAPPGPRVVVPGVFATPGFHDAHLHLEGIGREREEVDLRGATSVDDVRARVAAFLAARPTTSAVEGRGWDQNRFPGQAFPTARDLAALGDVPILLRRVDGHAVWVNEVVLTRAGITASTRAPDGGEIVRGPDGSPTGVLVDNAMALVAGQVPEPSRDDVARRLEQGLAACADAGLTAVHDMGMSPRALGVLVERARRAPLPVRVFVYLDGEDPASLALLAERAPAPRVTVVGIKVYADGAMGSRGALLLDDYDDAPGHRGLALTEPKLLEERVRQAHARGAQIAIHAIGDKGVRDALSAIAGGQGHDLSRRHRVEHVQLLAPEDVEGFTTLGVIASMQPVHCTSDAPWVVARIGPERARGAYAWRTLRTADVVLAFGSDAPVEDVRPTLGMHAALTRTDPAGLPAGGFYPEQKLFFHEALEAFTRGAAIAVRAERELGDFAPGLRFDATVFDQDPRGRPGAWTGTRAVATVVDGDVRVAAVETRP